MLIPIQHLLDADVITPEFCPTGEICGEPTITPVPVPRQVSQGATWVAVLGGAGPAANDCDDVIREFREHCRVVGDRRVRRMARRSLEGNRRAVQRMRERVRFEADDFEDFADDLVEVGDDGFELETVAPAPLAATAPGMTIGEIAGFVAAAGSSFAITHTAGALAMAYLVKRWPDVPRATAPIGVAGLVTITALALKFHRVPIAIGAGLAALVVASSRRAKTKTTSSKRKRQRARRKSRKKR